MKTMILYRPIGPAELELIAAAGFRAFPPRLPAEQLDEFNRQIVGDIEVIAEFRAPL